MISLEFSSKASAMHLDRMEWPADKVVASSLVMPEEQRTESKASSAFGISFLLQVRKQTLGEILQFSLLRLFKLDVEANKN